MRNLLAILTLILAAVIVGCDNDDPVGPGEQALVNKVWVDSISVSAQSKFILNVYVENKQPLNGIVVPLEYPGQNLAVDSIVFEDSRFEDFSLANAFIYPDDQSLTVSIFPDASELIDTSSGLLCKVYFWAMGNAPTQDVLIDTTENIQSSRFGFIDQEYAQFAPDFIPGLIHIEGFQTAGR